MKPDNRLHEVLAAMLTETPAPSSPNFAVAPERVGRRREWALAGSVVALAAMVVLAWPLGLIGRNVTDGAGAPQVSALVHLPEGQAGDLVLLTSPVPAQGHEDDTTEAATEVLNSLGSDVLDLLIPASERENVALSPTSLGYALAILEPATSETSRAQLKAMLGFDDRDVFHASMRALLASLDDSGDISQATRAELTLFGHIYVQSGFSVFRSYLDYVGAHYGAAASTANIAADPASFTAAVNRVVAEVTAERIPELFEPGDITSDSRVVIVNAIQFSADWKDPFPASGGFKGVFSPSSGDSMTVDLMLGTAERSSRSSTSVSVIKDLTDGFAVELVLPDIGRFTETAAQTMQRWANGDGTASSAEPQQPDTPVSVALPAFDLRYRFDVREYLEDRGVTDIFNAGTLPLSGLSNHSLAVTKVVHEAVVSFGEDGVVASAATGVVIGVLSVGNHAADVVFDRPFFFRIFDQRSGVNLFVGLVERPGIDDT